MVKQSITLNIPVLVKDNGKSLWCPFFNKTFDFSEAVNFPSINSNENEIEIISESSNPEMRNIQLNVAYVKKLSELVERLRELFEANYKEGNIEEPPGVERYSNIKLKTGEFWLTYTINLEIKKGYCERIMPKVAVVSAVLAQALGICSLGVSIYVKGISAPVTIILAAASATVTLMNFTQSDTTANVARIGRYLDYTSLQRYRQNISSLKDNKLLAGSTLLIGSIWVTNLAAGAISAFSETEIIYHAGYDKGLHFLSGELTFFNAMFYAILGGIAVGTFSGNFAFKAASNFSNWLQVKLDSREKIEANTPRQVMSEYHNENESLLMVSKPTSHQYV